MYLKNLLFALALSLISVSLSAQNGFLRGTVYDETLGEPMMSVSVVVEGTTRGIMTDLDGKFNLSLPTGTYNIRLSFVSYEPVVVNNVTITEGEVTLLDNLKLREASLGLEEVVVTASMTRNTETAMLAMKMSSPNLLDGITAVNFKKIGDSDAASSMRRVTGVSVEGGKYVYVRGLGDRYTKTIVNGVDVPGLDPDRNTMQLDIFPTNIIDNIMVHKSFSAELPADFTGGMIDIAIKDFPEDKTLNVSVGSAYNPDYHFRSDYLTYKGGSLDFLGFDDGTRKIPAVDNIPFYANVLADPYGETADRFRSILQGFDPVMAAMKQTSFIDYNFGVNFGNQIPKEKVTIGYNLAFSYKNSTEYYKNAEYGRYGLVPDPDVSELDVREFQKGDFGVNSALLSGLAGVAIKTRKSKYRLNIMHLQNGESKAGIFDYIGHDKGSDFTAYQHNLEYSQRSLTNLLLDGKYSPANSSWEIVWKISPTLSKINDPDARFVRYETDNNTLKIGTEAGFPERIWRELSEWNLGSVMHVTREFGQGSRKSKLHFGGAYTYKQRDFVIYKYALNIRNVPLTGDPDELFRPENIWPLNGTDINKGTTYEANFIPFNPNQYNANSNNIAAYVSGEFSIAKNLRSIIGVRMEKFVQRYTGRDQLGINVLDNDKVLDDINFFPSVNLVYSITDKQNIRISYAQTIARPSFKEMSFAEIYDPLSGRTFIGGMFRDANDLEGIEYWDGNLTSTSIHNLDLRWELFQANGQMISLSGFYKNFIRPIEIVQYATQVGSFQPRNVGDGKVLGIEVELRQNLGFISETLRNFSVSTNFSLTKSSIELSSTELASRIENARTGQVIKDHRVMAGQAPYIVNAGLTYDGGENGFWKGLEAGLYYNVQGITLQYVGIADQPDIFTLPFNSLNFNASKALGKNKKTQLGIKVENLLNDKKESVFKSYRVTDPFFTKLEPGITFHIKLSYSVF